VGSATASLSAGGDRLWLWAESPDALRVGGPCSYDSIRIPEIE
jgi:hypothetical protein